jgi:hypothetical protein
MLARHTPLGKSAPSFKDASIYRLVGLFRLARDASCVYCVVTTECRWVETKIPAPRLGTWGGGSQWCNRLPEVVTTSVADLAF